MRSHLEEQLAIAPWMGFARKCLGVREEPGDGDNAQIVQWIAACAPGRPWLARDATPWCSAFANAAMRAVGIAGTNSLAARSWLRWGDVIPASEARFGDVVIFSRGVHLPASIINAPGHVAFFDRILGDQILVCGGNQGQRVSINPYPLRRVLGYRRPKAEDLKLHDLLRGRGA